MSVFAIKCKWREAAADGQDEAAATLAQLQIVVDRKDITEHKIIGARPLAGRAAQSLEIPVYYLAEWLAENWWVLLFEPRKDESAYDAGYITRHSIVAAQHGFPLPSLSIVPVGRSIHLDCMPRVAPYAKIKFTAEAFADASHDDVERVIAEFVSNTVDRLKACGIGSSPLSRAWEAITALSPEERLFCELLGSLGIVPMEATDELISAIETIYGMLGKRAMRDFCLAASPEEVSDAVPVTEQMAAALDGAARSKLGALLSAKLPPENFGAPSWRRGMQAARSVREALGIEIKDPRGADRLFDALGIDPSTPEQVANHRILPFTGAIDREGDTAKIALLQADEPHRRFSASRAAYLGWVSEANSRRLVTNAVTRDQQASRSFAAEILIPQAHLKSISANRGALRRDQLHEIARQRRVMPDVVAKQAYNAGIRVETI